MCFFYALAKEAQELKNRYKATMDYNFEPVFYAAGFGYPAMSVVTNTEPDRIQPLHWGLIPPWTKTENIAKMRSYTLNARSDSLFVKPSFKNTTGKKRCLIPATGFFEWRDWRGKKYPYYIYLKDHGIFSLAGIWEEWSDPNNNESIKTYSIITTDANPLMSQIHNVKKRMPVILPPDKEGNWLQANLSEDEILAMTKPIDDKLMAAYSISKLITSKTQERNVPAILTRYRYPGLPEV